MRRLCGLTFPPSTLGLGAASWMESLRASHASPTARQGSSAATMTPGPGEKATDLSRTSSESWVRLDPPWSSSRTYQLGLLEDGFDLSEKNYADWVTSSKDLSSSLRRTLAHRISANGSGSWPTSRAEDSESCGNHPDATDSLTGAVRTWPTATAGEAKGRGYQYDNHDKTKPRLSLTGLSQAWKTPHGMSSADGGGGEFQKAVELWQTPKAGEEESGSGMNSRGEPKLKAQAQLWTTPKAVTGGPNSKREERGAGGPDLQEQAAHWPTPDASAEKYRLSGDSQQSKSLEPVSRAFSRQVLSTIDGRELSPTTRTLSRRLNPAFVAWLMGLPGWWTSPAVTNYVRSAMEAYRWTLRSHLQCLLGE
jgi:hypothetical protein